MTGSCPHDISLYTLLQAWSNFLSNITTDHDSVILTNSNYESVQTSTDVNHKGLLLSRVSQLRYPCDIYADQ